MEPLKTTKKHLFALVAFLLILQFAQAQMGWVPKASFPGAARAGIGEFTIGTNFYVGAGYNGSYLKDCYKYDAIANSWSAIASYPGNGSWSMSCFAIEGKGYFGLGLGSSGNSTDLWEYDPIGNTWTVKAPLPGTACYASVNFVLGHKAWFICDSRGGPPYYSDVWMYDAHQNTWKKMNPYPGGLQEGLMAFAIGNRGYAGCGWDGASEHNDMHQYDTTNDTWTTIAPFPGAGAGLGGGPQPAVVIGSKAYVLYGDNSTPDALPVAWVYDTVTKGWCAFSHLGKIARAYAASFTVNNKIYMAIGTDTNGSYPGPYVNDLWEYDPLSSIKVSDTDLCINPTVSLSGITTLDTTESVNWSWSMPGGTPSTSTSQYPNVTYTAGTYTVTLIASNCATADTVTRIIKVVKNTFPVTLKGFTSICTGQTDTISATGGGTYLWSTGATSSSIIVKPGTATTYSVAITNGLCTVDTSITVKPASTLAVSVTKDTSICSGNSVTLSASGGATYSWTPGGNTGSSVNVTPATTTTYTVLVSSGGCEKDTTVTVTVAPTPTVAVTPSQKICPGKPVTLTATGAGPYLWSNGATTSSITVSPTATTKYKVVVGSGCIDSASTTVTMDAESLTACCDTTIAPGDSVSIYSSGQNNYIWTPATSLSCSSCAVPTATPSVTTVYTVTSTDSAGCVLSKTVTINVEVPCADFTVPNVFTPNNDGRNDDFVILIENPSSYTIDIYDRWGKKVYTSNDATKYWNGTILNTAYLVPDGVYYYILKATCGNNTYNKKGFVQVLGDK